MTKKTSSGKNSLGNLLALLIVGLASAALPGCGKEKSAAVTPASSPVQTPTVAATPASSTQPASPAYEGVIAAPAEQGDQYVLKLTGTKSFSGDADCGVQQKNEIELWDQASKLQAFVGKTVSLTGKLDCPRGGYVLRDIAFGNSAAASVEQIPEKKQWVYRVIGEDPKGNVHYLAPATVSSNGHQATGFIVTNFGNPLPSQGGKGTAGSRLMSVEVMCDKPMIRTVQQMFRQGKNLAGNTLETSVNPTDFVTFPEGAMGQVYQMILCMDEGKRNQGLERNQAKFPQYQPLSFSPKDIER